MEYSTCEQEGQLFQEGFAFDVASLYAWLLKLKNGRKRRGIRYSLALILLMVILAKLGGEDGPKGMVEWLKHWLDFLVEHLKLKRATIPHPVTITRVLGKAINVAQFEHLLSDYFRSLEGAGKSVLITLHTQRAISTQIKQSGGDYC